MSKHNKRYAGKYTKREYQKRVNMVCICMFIMFLFTLLQMVIHSSNIILIENKEVLIEEVEASIDFSPLVAEKPQETKEIVVSKDYQYVIDYITEKSVANGLDVNWMLAIAERESGFNPQAKNSTSSAEGVFQFINSTWDWVSTKRGVDYVRESKLDYKNNIDNAMWLMKNSGPHHWECYTLKTLAYEKYSIGTVYPNRSNLPL